MTVKVRYKAPDGKTSKLLSRPVKKAELVTAPSVDFRWASAMAGFGMLLRDSPYHGNASWKDLAALARGALGKDTEGYRAEALRMIDVASRIPRQP